METEGKFSGAEGPGPGVCGLGGGGGPSRRHGDSQAQAAASSRVSPGRLTEKGQRQQSSEVTGRRLRAGLAACGSLVGHVLLG